MPAYIIRDSKNSISQPINVKDKKEYPHPTIKPLNVIKTLIGNSTRPGDIVLDPFLGSGTTAIACMELGRKYIGYEINDGVFRGGTETDTGYDRTVELITGILGKCKPT